MAMPSWDVIEQELRKRPNIKPEDITATKQDYDSRYGSELPPNANVTTKPIMYPSGRNRYGTTMEAFNPVAEELKKTVELKAQAENGIQQIDEMWSLADELIPAAKHFDFMGKDIGIMGRVQGLQRALTAPIGLDEKAKTWDDTKEGFKSLFIRSLGEKGTLTEQDIRRSEALLPSFYDSDILRELKKDALKRFLGASINAYSQRVISLSPDLLEHFTSLKSGSDRRKFLESLQVAGAISFPDIKDYTKDLQ